MKKRKEFWKKKLLKNKVERVEWNDGEIHITKRFDLTKNGVEFFREVEKDFEKKFGRKPKGDDPIFCDPDYDYPHPYTEEKLRKIITEACVKAGLDVERGLRSFGLLDDDYVEIDDRAFFEVSGNN